MTWGGSWQSGRYAENEVVLDEGWLMICKEPTGCTTRPAPQPIGPEFYVYDGTEPTTFDLAKQILFGNRYTFSIAAYVTGWRIWTVVGNEYTVYTISDPEGAAVISELGTFTGNGGWAEFGLSDTIIPAGVVFDLFARVQEPDPTPTTFTGNWNYDTPNNAGTPASGVILHANQSTAILSIHKTDDDGTDRSAALAALAVGDVIEGPNIRWAIQSLTDQTTYLDVGISPAVQEAPDGIYQFTFETVTATPITYLEDTDHWLTAPYDVEGLLKIDSAATVINDNAYGADISVQQISLSDEWEVLSSAGVVGATSGPSINQLATGTAGKEPNGFEDRSQCTLSWDNATRTATLTGPYVFWSNGRRFIKYVDSIQIADTEGGHFIYYDEEGALQIINTFDLDIILADCFVAYVYWDATNDKAIPDLICEKHGSSMPAETHTYLHNTNGSVYNGGLLLTATSVDGTGNGESAARFSGAAGSIRDEDIIHTIAARGNTDDMPVVWREGAAGNWRMDNTAEYPVLKGTTYAYYNEWTGATWQRTEAGNNNYVLAHIYACPGVNETSGYYLAIMGQGDYTTINAARLGAETELFDLDFGSLPSVELFPVATMIFQTSSTYSNAVASRLRSTDLGDDYIDWRDRRRIPSTS